MWNKRLTTDHFTRVRYSEEVSQAEDIIVQLVW